MVFYNTMTQYIRLLLLACAVGVAAMTLPAAAAVRSDLFQATVPLADRSEAAQAAAFQAALRAVLVKVTGVRSAGEDPSLAPLVSEARRFVQQYRAANDHDLWVAFDAGAIERWLTQSGHPVWGRERPTTFVWLAVQSGANAGSIVTQGDSSELKAQLDAAASERGITLLWPSGADLQNNRLDYATLTTAPTTTLAALARRLGADATLVGRAGISSVHWILMFQDRNTEFSGAAEGAERAADTYAALFASSGSPAPIDIDVSGIDAIHGYAAALNYLESLAFVSHVGVESLSGDVVRFRLETRGGPEPLRRALAMNGLLEPDASTDGAVQRFHLHR
jgi:hypothetical protein